jgi:pimeloyl-ACP methyl ester carboxylesterase
MKRFAVFLFFTLCLGGIFSVPLFSQDVNGRWEGSLNYGGSNIPLIFNIAQQQELLSALLDSPSQGAMDIPVDSVKLKGDSLFLYLPRMGVIYSGRLDKARKRMSGLWQQGGLSLPLNMEKVSVTVRKLRSQEPTEPLPYHQEDVLFENKEAGISLAGTFTRPAGEGQHPAVVLISGSGPQDRDETILGHKPFLVLADYLTRQGMAVLRYDDRGFGQSQGKFVTATTADFATDAAAAIQYLQYRSDVKANEIGIIGHSEGGLIAPMVAQQEKNPVAFMVLLAGPAVPGHELMVAQVGAIAKARKMPQATIDQQKQLQGELLSIILHQQDSLEAAQQLQSLLTLSYEEMPQQDGASAPTAAQINVQVAQLLSPWFRGFVAYNPQPALREIQIPTLALFGGKDVQVPAISNMSAIEALQNKHIQARAFPDYNHLFQPATTGLPQEYGTIETTMAPEVLETISQWILEQLPGTTE